MVIAVAVAIQSALDAAADRGFVFVPDDHALRHQSGRLLQPRVGRRQGAVSACSLGAAAAVRVVGEPGRVVHPGTDRRRPVLAGRREAWRQAVPRRGWCRPKTLGPPVRRVRPRVPRQSVPCARLSTAAGAVLRRRLDDRRHPPADAGRSGRGRADDQRTQEGGWRSGLDDPGPVDAATSGDPQASAATSRASLSFR